LKQNKLELLKQKQLAWRWQK